MFAKTMEFITWVNLETMPYDRVTEGVGAHATGFARAFIEDDKNLVIIPTFEDDTISVPGTEEEVVEEREVLDWWFGEQPDTEEDFV